MANKQTFTCYKYKDAKIMPKIDKRHNDYDTFVSKWELIDDICDEKNIEKYIIPINPDDLSQENKTRNEQYRKRAVFAAISGYTSRGLSGILFQKWPKLQIPKQLEYIKNNIDGSGTSIYQQSQGVGKSVIRKGRAGLLVDYPDTKGSNSTLADLQSLKVFPSVHRFEPEQIIDWGLSANGAVVKLSRVVLLDTIHNEDSDMEVLRELVLVDGFYISREYRKDLKTLKWELYSEHMPTDGAGNPWDEIPFIFVGSETNTHTVDQPVLYNICRLNIGHLNNSAEYEDSVYMIGQPMFYAVGLTVPHVEEMEAAGMKIGSNRLFPIPDGGSAGIIQAQPNTLAKDAMDNKEKQMIALGAMFIAPGSAVKTATQSQGEQQVQHSVLSLIANNISEAYTKCLHWMARFLNVSDTQDIEYTVHQDFVPKQAEAQMYMALLAGTNAGTLPISDFITWQQRNQIIDPEKTVEEVKEELNYNSNTNIPDLDDGVYE